MFNETPHRLHRSLRITERERAPLYFIVSFGMLLCTDTNAQPSNGLPADAQADCADESVECVVANADTYVELASSLDHKNFGMCDKMFLNNKPPGQLGKSYLRFTVEHASGGNPIGAKLILWVKAPVGVELEIARTSCAVDGGAWLEGDGDCDGDVAAFRELSGLVEPEDEVVLAGPKPVPVNTDFTQVDINVLPILGNRCGGFTICLAVRTTNSLNISATIASKEHAAHDPRLEVTYPSSRSGGQCTVPIPTASEWGLVALVLAIMVAGTIIVRFSDHRLKAILRPCIS